MTEPIRAIFDNLNRSRHLPSYQLERRLDIFLTPYLHRIIEAHVGTPLDPVIIPEMPLKQAGTNLTDKADYVLFSADRQTAYLVELKTDCASIREEQLSYLERCCQAPWRQALEGLKAVVKASQQRRKYIHLIHLLQRAGQVELTPKLLKCFETGATPRFEENWVMVTTAIEKVRPL
jgi:hypothetical protein